jgi:secreted PhoX family phosphatase
VLGSSLWTLGCGPEAFGRLREPDENGIRLPPGFRSRVLAVSGDPVGPSGYVWHGAPDGGAVFPSKDGWIYVSNAELLPGGGAGALRFDHAGRVVDAYPICSGTRRNCAGGATPWGTWLSCEEVPSGLVFECDPEGREAAVARTALGAFQHEAVAADPERRQLYLTEDQVDGRLYRFTPAAWERLDVGVLEVAEVDAAGGVRWHPLPNPLPGPGQTPTRRQVPASTAFRGGEGIVWDRGHVYFTTKGDDRVWDLDVAAQTLEVFYDRAADPAQPLAGVDNIAVTRSGELIVAEDGDNMELVMLTRSGRALVVLRVEGQNGSELAGPAFDPTGRRLYVSSQRGRDGRGITYEIHGPFRPRR